MQHGHRSVPFPRLRSIVPRRLARALDHSTWEEVWPVLEANLRSSSTAVLARVGDDWRYTITSDHGDRLFDVPLPGRVGAVLAAAVSVDGSPTVPSLIAWLDAHPAVWSPSGRDPSERAASVRGAGRDLRTALADIPVGLEDFALPASGYAVQEDVTLADGAVQGVPSGWRPLGSHRE